MRVLTIAAVSFHPSTFPLHRVGYVLLQQALCWNRWDIYRRAYNGIRKWQTKLYQSYFGAVFVVEFLPVEVMRVESERPSVENTRSSKSISPRGRLCGSNLNWKFLFELQLASNDHRVTLRMAEIHDQFDTILILDFGSQVSDSLMTRKLGWFSIQYSHLITRRCREHNVYAELLPCTAKLADLHFKPKGLFSYSTISISKSSVLQGSSSLVHRTRFMIRILLMSI